MKSTLLFCIILTVVACTLSGPVPDKALEGQVEAGVDVAVVAGDNNDIVTVEAAIRTIRSPNRRKIVSEEKEESNEQQKKFRRKGRFFAPYGGYTGYANVPVVRG